MDVKISGNGGTIGYILINQKDNRYQKDKLINDTQYVDSDLCLRGQFISIGFTSDI
jgi:hypothetical protein